MAQSNYNENFSRCPLNPHICMYLGVSLSLVHTQKQCAGFKPRAVQLLSFFLFWRWVGGAGRKEELYCFARQTVPQWAHALRTARPDLEGLVRSLMVMVQRGRDQLVDILLMGWWGGKWESASSTFWFQPVWGPHASGQQTVNFSHLVGGLSICKTAQSYCYVYPLRENQDPGLKAELLFLFCCCLLFVLNFYWGGVCNF